MKRIRDGIFHTHPYTLLLLGFMAGMLLVLVARIVVRLIWAWT